MDMETTLKMEIADSAESLITIYYAMQDHTPEGNTAYSHR
jgi:hypothetical protein